MKAICNNRVFKNVENGSFVIEKGEIVDYAVNNKKFIVKDVLLNPTTFFAHFKVMDGKDRMLYTDFEYILCNYMFTDAVLFPNEYSGVHHLIIQGWGGVTIFITVNKEENIIRVFFDDKQEKYTSYEDALEGIRNHNRQ